MINTKISGPRAPGSPEWLGSEHRPGVALDSGTVHLVTGGKAEDSGTRAGQRGPAGACGPSVPTASAEGRVLEVCPQQKAKAGPGVVHVLGKHQTQQGAAERAHVRTVCYALAGIRRGPTNGLELLRVGALSLELCYVPSMEPKTEYRFVDNGMSEGACERRRKGLS